MLYSFGFTSEQTALGVNVKKDVEYSLLLEVYRTFIIDMIE